jgi:hypothetical protein
MVSSNLSRIGKTGFFPATHQPAIASFLSSGFLTG